MYVCVRVLVCVCIEVYPSHATEKPSISAAREPVEDPYFALHSPLLASKAVWSSWSLVVISICALIARGEFNPELVFRAGISSYFWTSSYHALYKYENIGYAEVPEDRLYNTHVNEYMNAYVPFVTYKTYGVPLVPGSINICTDGDCCTDEGTRKIPG